MNSKSQQWRLKIAERPTFDEVLKKRDGYTDEETAEARRDILDRIMDGEDGFDVIEEYGLEPDYLEDLLF